jgi:hypothetical protein
MNMTLIVVVWVVVIGAAFWCLLKGGRPGGGCGGCGGGGSGGGCGTTGEGDDEELRAEVSEVKDTGPGEDEGSETRLATGYVWVSDIAHAAFYVHWTVGRSKHPAMIDLVLGDHEEDAGPERRIGISLTYRYEEGEGEFAIVDATDRPFADPEYLGKALRRSEVAGTPLAREAFEIAQCIFRSHPLFAEIETVA